MKNLIKPGAFVIGGIIVGAVLVMGLGSAKGASDTLNWGQELNAAKCVKAGKPVIEVTQRVFNSVDSGQAGNNWAFDDYRRNIQVWTQENGTYCAVVKYQGKYDAQSGQRSPGNTGVLDGDEDGTFEGGYRGTISGVLKTNPQWKVKGTIGEVDYGCDISGNCPGAINWLGQYFNSGFSLSYDWWGWIYHGGKFGTWVNSQDLNSGDIN